MKKKQFYFKHEHDKDLKKPVTRSSAVFYFNISDKENTSIHFLNYWKVKRGISELTIQATLRAMNGETILKQPIELCEQGAMNIDVKSILNSNKVFEVSEGSIEIEIFSKENMAISYPAAIVRYSGEGWHTSTHTSQRVFSEDSGDSGLEDIKFAEEGNQTIQSNKDLEPMFVIHNGRKPFSDEEGYIEVFGANGAYLKADIPKLDWKANETKVLFLKDILDYREVLDGGIGSYRIGFNACGVFPRIIAGFKNTITGAISIDHTNFAAKSGPVLEDQFDIVKENGFINLAFNIPNNSEENWNCFADIYPTYPEKDYKVEALLKGQKAKEVPLPKSIEKKTTRVDLSESSFSKLNFINEEKLPRRFHVGVHYQIGNGDPGFLIDGPLPHESSAQKTRWAPIFAEENTENYLLISNRVLGRESPFEIDYKARVYNSFSEDPFEFSFKIGPEETKVIKFEENKELKDYLKGAPGWCYMQTEKPAKCVFHYVSIKNGNSIACDHAF